MIAYCKWKYCANVNFSNVIFGFIGSLLASHTSNNAVHSLAHLSVDLFVVFVYALTGEFVK